MKIAQSPELSEEPGLAADQNPLSVAAAIDTYSGDPDFMTSLARGLAVLETFSKLKRPPTISQLSAKTGLSRAAVRRCLYTLARLGFVATDEAQRYVLLPKVLALGYGYLSAKPFAEASQPVLDRLGTLLRESCSVSVLEDDEIVYVARASVTRIMSVDLRIGSRLPAFCTSMGRVLLADLSPAELEAHLPRPRLKKYTNQTVTSISKLKQILRMVQHDGFCVVDQELEQGLRSVAVPIRNPKGKIVAALNAGTQAQRVTIDELRTTFLTALQDAAQEIGMLLA